MLLMLLSLRSFHTLFICALDVQKALRVFLSNNFTLSLSCAFCSIPMILSMKFISSLNIHIKRDIK